MRGRVAAPVTLIASIALLALAPPTPLRAQAAERCDVASPGQECSAIGQSVESRVARLKAIALALKPAPPPPSLWQRLTSRIKAWLAPLVGESPGWLQSLPRWHLGAGTARLLFYALALLVIAAVGFIIAIEARAAGVFGRRQARPSGIPASPGDPPTSSEHALVPDAIDAAPERERPGLLLRLLIEALTRSKRLARERDLTCRELITLARFDTPSQREEFLRVALLAERVRYGPAGPLPDLQEALAGARMLHAELIAAPADARSDP